MSEYQYYEFQAIDRPLAEGERQLLRDLSTRARITATSFTNSYEWGSFKGDPAKLMEQWFDLHLYVANWGTRRLMIRLPARMVDRPRVTGMMIEVDGATLHQSGDNLILDIVRDEVDTESDDWEEGSGRLAALAPLRADVMAGDLRLFYLLWLTAVEADIFADDETEPLPGIGPITGALEAFVDFFGIDRDLVAAAAERPAEPLSGQATSPAAVRGIISAMSEDEKTGLLARLFDGDAHVPGELRGLVRARLASETGAPALPPRRVGELQSRAEAIRAARERLNADKAKEELERREAEAHAARRARLDALIRRGDGVWREVEDKIEVRNAAGYDQAAALLSDLKAMAQERGTLPDFLRRLHAIRERHHRKGQFIQRVADLG